MRGRAGSERGESLLELLLAVAIMGIALVAVIGSMQGSILASDIHHKQSTAGGVLQNFAEFMKNEATAPFVDCPVAVTTYGSYKSAFALLLASPSSKVYEPDHSRYALALTVVPGTPAPPGPPDPDPAITFPNPVNSSTCASATAPGATDPAIKHVQLLRLTVLSNDNRVTELIDVVKWKP